MHFGIPETVLRKYGQHGFTHGTGRSDHRNIQFFTHF
jgi:hypothetical protein